MLGKRALVYLVPRRKSFRPPQPQQPKVTCPTRGPIDAGAARSASPFFWAPLQPCALDVSGERTRAWPSARAKSVEPHSPARALILCTGAMQTAVASAVHVRATASAPRSRAVAPAARLQTKASAFASGAPLQLARPGRQQRCAFGELCSRALSVPRGLSEPERAPLVRFSSAQRYCLPQRAPGDRRARRRC